MSTGLLVLCSPLNILQSRVGRLATAAAQHVGKTLYVQLEPGQAQLWPLLNSPSIHQNPDFIKKCSSFIESFYKKCYHASQTLDVRFLLSNLKHPRIEKIVLSKDLDVILTDLPQSLTATEKYMSYRFQNPCISANILNIETDDNEEHTVSLQTNGHTGPQISSSWKIYDNVVLGGTFDRLHSGHKILLSNAILHCEKQLTTGVTDGPMNRGKILWEMMEPVDIRISALNDFLNDVDRSLNYKTQPILDPFGPSIEDPDLQCIVVSEETLKGGQKVNEEREKRGLNVLDVQIIKLIEDDQHDIHEDNKVSSSSFRIRSLGVRRSIELFEKPQLAQFPYIIGLTGGIASGKSSIAKYLLKLGAAIVDCDKLGHLTYSTGTAVYHQIIQHFGSDIIGPDGAINRRALGAKVFANKSKMDELNGIVWPEIRRLIKEHIQELSESGVRIVIVDAAILLDAGWQDMVHEVWVSIIPENEAVKRITQRDNIDESQAQHRINRQMSNTERVACANVVFCTLWEPEFTQKQVENAWKSLSESILLKTNKHSQKL